MKTIIEDDDPQAAAKADQASTATAAGSSLDVDFGDENLMARGDGFDKIIPPENDKSALVRVAMLTDITKPKSHFVHFVTGKGSFLCNSERDAKGLITKQAACCRKLGNDDKQKAAPTILVLAFHYKNADPKTGKYLVKKDREGNEYQDPIEWEIGYIKLSKSGYRRVTKLIQEDQKPHEFDMTISWKDSGVGFEYNCISQKVRFRQNPALLEEVLEAAEKFRDGVALTKKLGKRITDLEYLAMLSGTSATNAKDASVDDVRDL